MNVQAKMPFTVVALLAVGCGESSSHHGAAGSGGSVQAAGQSGSGGSGGGSGAGGARAGRGGGAGGASGRGGESGRGGSGGVVGGAGTGAAGASGGTPGGRGGSGGAAGSNVGGTSGVGEDAGAAGAEAGSPGAPMEEPSRQTVTFHFTTSAASRYVPVAALGCGLFSIERRDPTSSVQTALANPCGPCATCPNPTPGILVVHELLPGEFTDLLWDGRETTVVSESVSCGGAGSVTYDRPIAMPLPPGRYAARLAAFTSAPPGCDTSGVCNPPVTTTQTALPYASLCTSEAPIEVEFELPASGDVSVPVSVP